MSLLDDEKRMIDTNTIFKKLKKKMLGESYEDCYGFPTKELYENVAFNKEMTEEEKTLLCSLKKLISYNKLTEDSSVEGLFFWAPCYDIKETGDSNKFTINDYDVWNLGSYDPEKTRITLFKDRISEFVYKLNGEQTYGSYNESYMSALVLVFHYGLFLLHKFPIDGKCDCDVFPKDGNGLRIKTSILSMFATLVLTWTVLESQTICKDYLKHYRMLWKYHPEYIRDIKPFAGRCFLKPVFESIKYFRERPLDTYQSEYTKLFK